MRKKKLHQKLNRKFSQFIKRKRTRSDWEVVILDQEDSIEEPECRKIPDNPFIPQMRGVIDFILQKRGQSYGQFYPVILDFDEPKQEQQNPFDIEVDVSEEDAIAKYELETELARIRTQIDEVLALLTPGLNRLLIRTNRPAYFEEFVQTMYDETGLPVQLEVKERQEFPAGCTILDFEFSGSIGKSGMRGANLYLPIYKKPWKIAGNLDIEVPIGYNTVIVEGLIEGEEESVPDRFEREFYAK